MSNRSASLTINIRTNEMVEMNSILSKTELEKYFFLGSSSGVLYEDGCHKSVIWICSSVSKAIFFKNAEEKYRYTTILQNNKILRFILWHLHCFSSFASVLLVSQIVTVLKLSLSSDMGEAGLTADSCQNAGATNEQKVFPVSSWFENLLLFCLQWKLQYSRNYKSVQRIQMFV